MTDVASSNHTTGDGCTSGVDSAVSSTYDHLYLPSAGQLRQPIASMP